MVSFLFVLKLDLPPILETELIFAVSARATDSPRNFKKMQDVMKRVVRQYGMDRIHYSIITFGSTPNTILKFNNNIKDDGQLERFIGTLQINGRGADLDKALEKAKDLFDEAETLRSGTKKVLVVITDKRSGNLFIISTIIIYKVWNISEIYNIILLDI